MSKIERVRELLARQIEPAVIVERLGVSLATVSRAANPEAEARRRAFEKQKRREASAARNHQTKGVR
jgi:Trp operon repressor